MPETTAQKTQRIHFLGIAGVGMSALAQAMIQRGHSVSGTDPSRNPSTDRLEASGARLFEKHEASNVTDVEPDLVVYSAAVHPENPEMAAAREAGIPTIVRADMLGKVMAEYGGPRIAVTGTHGKTTVTAMIATILVEAGVDPTIFLGAELDSLGGNARIGNSEIMLTEACEAYDSFLSLRPDIAVVTNVDYDHTDYYATEQALHDSFTQFSSNILEGGVLIACGDDVGVRQVFGNSEATLKLYGLDSDDLYVKGSVQQGSTLAQLVNVSIGGKPAGTFTLYAPGKHNVQNALAAITATHHCGIAFDVAATALETFRGAERRFEILGERDGRLVVDDYAHHPTEITATLSAATTAYPDRRLVAVFQPHLYSRTRDFLDGFAEALTIAEAIIVTNIYPAREKPIPGVTAGAIVQKIAERAPRNTVLFVPALDDVKDTLEWVTHPGDIVLVMGAGDVRKCAEDYLAAAKA
jgi:UDP-N-acetylmuramate--alanine ligase